MVSFLDFLVPGGVAKSMLSPTPETPGTLPAPNPLRLPPTSPPHPGVLDGGFLSSIFQLPPIPFVESAQERKIKVDRAEGEARDYYSGKDGPARVPDRGARNAQGKRDTTDVDQNGVPDVAQDTEDGDEDSEEGVPVPTRAPGVSSAQPKGPGGDVRVPYSPLPPPIDPFRAMMLQMGLNLMTPQWGNTMSQIGQAVGGGMAAGGRAQQMNRAEEERGTSRANAAEDRGLKNRKLELETQQTELENEALASGESSRSKRLRGRQPTIIDELATAEGLGPKGKAYVAQRIKEIGKEDPLDEDADPTAKFEQILVEAKKLDAPSGEKKAPNVGGTESGTGVDVKDLPLVASPAEAKKLAPGTMFKFMQNGKEVIGRVPQ